MRKEALKCTTRHFRPKIIERETSNHCDHVGDPLLGADMFHSTRNLEQGSGGLGGSRRLLVDRE